MSTGTEIENKKTMSYWIHTVICIGLMVGIGFLPPIGGAITPFGMKVLGIFVGTFYGWIFLEFIWPSLLGLVLLGLTDYSTIGAAFTEGLKNDSTVNILIMFVFAAYLEHSGALTWLTYWIVSRKVLVGKPWTFTMVFICSIIPISIFVNVYAGIILLWAMFASLCTTVGYTKKDLYVTYVCGGIAQIGGIVSIAFPFQPFSQLIFNLAGPTVGITELPFMQWSLMGIATIIIYPIIYFLLGKFILRVDASKLTKMEDQFAQYRNIKMNADQKFGMFLLALFVILLILPSFLSGNAKVFFSNFGIQGGAIACLVLAFLWQIYRGTKLYTFGNMVRDGVSWDLIILFIVTFPLCTALESEDAGVVSTVISSIMPIVNAVSPIVFLILVCVFFCLCTQVAHNLVLIIALTPSLAKICVGVGIDPIMFGIVFCLCMLTSCSTPAASANTAMVFGHTEWVERNYAFKVGVGNLIVWLLTAVCIMIPLGMLIF